MIIEQFAGLRNDVVTERFTPPDLQTGLNVTIDDSNNLARRPGATLTISANAHSLWADDNICLYVDAGLLKQVHPDWSTTTLRTGLADYPVSYALCAGRVYYTNGIQNGVIEDGVNRTFGLDVPGDFVATDTTGDLCPGQYIYALCYVRSDGQESGVGAGSPVQVTNGGIAFSSIPVSADPDVTQKILFCTSADGVVMYETAVLDNATTSYTLTDGDFEVPCETVHMCAPPAGHLICEYFGHLLVAQDNYLYRSQAYGPEIFDPTDFIGLPERITMLAPTESGIYVSTDTEIGFISGTDPDQFTYSAVAEYGAVEGSLTYVHTHRLNYDVPEGIAAIFMTSRGICVGLPGGSVTNITDTRFETLASDRGASVIQQIGGSAVFITTTQ